MTGDSGARLRVDPIACDGRGLCAEALPELITLDDWGFPISSGQPVPDWLLADARETVRACPKLALRLEHLRSPPVITSSTPGGGARSRTADTTAGPGAVVAAELVADADDHDRLAAGS